MRVEYGTATTNDRVDAALDHYLAEAPQALGGGEARRGGGGAHVPRRMVSPGCRASTCVVLRQLQLTSRWTSHIAVLPQYAVLW